MPCARPGRHGVGCRAPSGDESGSNRGTGWQAGAVRSLVSGAEPQPAACETGARTQQSYIYETHGHRRPHHNRRHTTQTTPPAQVLQGTRGVHDATRLECAPRVPCRIGIRHRMFDGPELGDRCSVGSWCAYAKGWAGSRASHQSINIQMYDGMHMSRTRTSLCTCQEGLEGSCVTSFQDLSCLAKCETRSLMSQTRALSRCTVIMATSSPTMNCE